MNRRRKSGNEDRNLQRIILITAILNLIKTLIDLADHFLG